jgi:hypothetical protein
MTEVDITIEGRTYTLPVVVIENIRLFRGIEAIDCASVEQYRSPVPYVWVTTDPHMARMYGRCIFQFKPEGSVLRLLDIWSPPVIRMMDELLSNRSRLFNTMGKVDAWESEYTGRGLKPRTAIPTVQKIGPVEDEEEMMTFEKRNALSIFEGSRFVPSKSNKPDAALEWRGLIWGDEPGEFSRYSGSISDKWVTEMFFELIKETELDGLYAPMLPSFMHNTISIRNVFDEEIIILKSSLDRKYNPPDRYGSGGRRKTRRRQAHKKRRTRHIQRRKI